MLKDKKPLSNTEIMQFCSDIPRFRGVFLRDTLPSKPLNDEVGVLNLDCSASFGTHWVIWIKANDNCYYVDTFGYGPPLELIKYLKHNIIYSTFILQDVGTSYCGHVCLLLLDNYIKTGNFISSLLYLVEGDK